MGGFELHCTESVVGIFLLHRWCHFSCNGAMHQFPLHPPEVTVWCAVGSFGIIGPYFFEENRVTVTVNSVRYIHMVDDIESRTEKTKNPFPAG